MIIKEFLSLLQILITKNCVFQKKPDLEGAGLRFGGYVLKATKVKNALVKSCASGRLDVSHLTNDLQFYLNTHGLVAVSDAFYVRKAVNQKEALFL